MMSTSIHPSTIDRQTDRQTDRHTQSQQAPDLQVAVFGLEAVSLAVEEELGEERVVVTRPKGRQVVPPAVLPVVGRARGLAGWGKEGLVWSVWYYW